MVTRTENNKPVPIVTTACVNCAACVAVCGTGALRMTNVTLEIRADRCNGCGDCTAFCPAGALKA